LTQNLHRLLTLSLSLAAPLALAQEGVGTTDTTGSTSALSPAARPEGVSLGFGAGWTFPGAASVFTPDTAALRLRLGGVTLEPAFTFRGNGTGTREDESVTLPNQTPQTGETENRAGGYNLGLNLSARFDLASRGPLDLVGILGGRFGLGSTLTQLNVDQTDQRNEQRATTTSAGLDWGLGVVWFLRQNLSVSADVTNPLVTYSVQRTDNERDLPNGTQVRETEVSNSLNYGLTLNPQLRVLFHLYF
jgi:hypothetical protein